MLVCTKKQKNGPSREGGRERGREGGREKEREERRISETFILRSLLT